MPFVPERAMLRSFWVLEAAAVEVEVILRARAWRAVANVDVPVERLGMERRVVEAEFTTSNAFPVDAELPQMESLLYGVEVPMPTN